MLVKRRVDSKKRGEFYQRVVCNFELYNSLFLALPFEGVRNTGVKLPLFESHLQEAIKEGQSPIEAIESFFLEVLHVPKSDELPILFSFIQFIERQILLFDALEDASFAYYTDTQGLGSLSHLLARVLEEGKEELLANQLENTTIRIVLTAHPTQFYSKAVLGILRDLTVAIRENHLQLVNDLLMQLGKTPFQSAQSPTPLDEAESLLWTVKTVFYSIIPQIRQRIKIALGSEPKGPIIELGFWPGGDRDGNPTVTSEVTEAVLKRMRESILELYLEELDELDRRLTFRHISEELVLIRRKLDRTLEMSEEAYIDAAAFLEDLRNLKNCLIEEHSGLFVEKVDVFISIVESFGFHFTRLDLRQDASVHQAVAEECGIYTDQDFERLMDSNISEGNSLNLSASAIELMATFRVAKEAQIKYGELALHRYIISNTQAAKDVLNVLACAQLSGWKIAKFNIDIVPLFETTDDLKHAKAIMGELYAHPIYRKHLKKRQMKQTVMLGFSDGTKDGGYLTANWGIYQCRQELYKQALDLGVELIFFDGRGGPPARGGGNTHKFYRAMSKIPSDIHLTIQGQTITSKFGTDISGRHNLEQLLTAVLYPKLFSTAEDPLNRQKDLLSTLSDVSYQFYQELKADPLFMPYLTDLSPLPYFGDLNIASRPVSRNQGNNFVFKDLRAIPFVGSWSQIKQVVPAYYGMGKALSQHIEKGGLDELKELYATSLFFRTLLNNAEQSLAKSRFDLTQYLEKDERFSLFWTKLRDEASLCQKALLEISGESSLLDDEPIVQASVFLRERLIFPLTVIQQYGLMHVRKGGGDLTVYQNLIRRSIAAILNASRNSA